LELWEEESPSIEMAQENTPTKTERKDPLADLKPDVFENANTITKWLLSQAEDAQPQYGPIAFERLFPFG
jgi:hypothetical protein